MPASKSKRKKNATASAPQSHNSGVHGTAGFEFQKFCVLYLIFSDYNSYESKQYFVCMESLDDVIICDFNDDDSIRFVDAYQAKKSSNKWGLNKTTIEIIQKLTTTGQILINDKSQKDPSYTHNLTFATNSAIELKCDIPKSPGVSKNSTITEVINESNDTVEYSALPTEIKDRIQKSITSASLQLPHLRFKYIDFSKRVENQKRALVGLFGEVFGSKVADHYAAIETLLTLLRKSENTLNQGNIAKLSDKTKRVYSKEINDTINIICTKQKAYSLWREYGREISNTIGIPLSKRDGFSIDIQNAFDLFKDPMQVEYSKIRQFVRSNHQIFDRHTDEIRCIEELQSRMATEMNLLLPDMQKHAALIAAYIEERPF